MKGKEVKESRSKSGRSRIHSMFHPKNSGSVEPLNEVPQSPDKAHSAPTSATTSPRENELSTSSPRDTEFEKQPSSPLGRSTRNASSPDVSATELPKGFRLPNGDRLLRDPDSSSPTTSPRNPKLKITVYKALVSQIFPQPLTTSGQLHPHQTQPVHYSNDSLYILPSVFENLCNKNYAKGITPINSTCRAILEQIFNEILEPIIASGKVLKDPSDYLVLYNYFEIAISNLMSEDAFDGVFDIYERDLQPRNPDIFDNEKWGELKGAMYHAFAIVKIKYFVLSSKREMNAQLKELLKALSEQLEKTNKLSDYNQLLHLLIEQLSLKYKCEHLYHRDMVLLEGRSVSFLDYELLSARLFAINPDISLRKSFCERLVRHLSNCPDDHDLYVDVRDKRIGKILEVLKAVGLTDNSIETVLEILQETDVNSLCMTNVPSSRSPTSP